MHCHLLPDVTYCHRLNTGVARAAPEPGKHSRCRWSVRISWLVQELHLPRGCFVVWVWHVRPIATALGAACPLLTAHVGAQLLPIYRQLHRWRLVIAENLSSASNPKA
jgi:hypothetical protein